MARRRTRVRFSRSVRVAAVALLAAATTTVLFEADIGRSLLLSSAMVAGAPPVLYALLALVLLRGTPLDRRLGWAVAACGVYAALGLLSGLTLSLAHPMSLEGALRRSLWSFAPAPFVHLVASPLVMIAWRSRLIPVRLMVRAESGSAPPSVARSSATPLRPGSPDWDSVLHVSPPVARASGSSSAAAERTTRERDSSPETPGSRERASTAVPRQPISQASDPAPAPAAPAAMVAAPSSVAKAVTNAPPPVRSVPKPHLPEPPILPPADAVRKSAAPAPAPSVKPAVPEEPRGGETGPVIRIPFDRIADQLPPDVFTLPPGRLAESLQEPHALLVPLRLVLPQLGEGAVEVPWALVEAQFPELAFAMPQAEVRRRFPEWVLSLPMDVVVTQIPSDLFRVAGLAADLSGIGDFPAPFAPGPPEPEPPAPDSRPTAQPAPISTPPVVAAPAVSPVASKPTVERAPRRVVEAPTPTPTLPTAPTATDTGADIRRALSAAETAATAVAPPAPVPVSKPRTSPVAAPQARTESVPAASRTATVVEPSSPVLTVPAPAVTPPPNTAATVRPSRATDHDSESLAHVLAPGLAPLGAFDWRVWRVAGDRVVSFVPPSLTREPIDAMAAQAAGLVRRLASWRIEQMTIRTARLACVLTPLDAAWLVATVRRGGSVAMLELLSVRAVRASGRSAGAATSAMTFPAVGTTPAGESARHRDVAEAARALAAFGPVTASVAEPDGTAPGVYVFAGGDGTVLAGAARAVYDALVPGHDQEALGQLDSVVFRRGRERVVVRPLRGPAGAPAVLATAGEVSMAGRAHRAAAQAAAALETT